MSKQKEKEPPIDLSDLPENWTIRDVEDRMPKEIRESRWPYQLLLMVVLPTNEVNEAEFFVEFNYDERDAFTAAMQKFVDSGRLRSFKVKQIGIARADFAETIIHCLEKGGADEISLSIPQGERIMKIIKAGTKPKDRKHKTTCGHCRTTFEFLEGEAKLINDFRDGDYFDVECPYCHMSVTVDVTLPLNTSDDRDDSFCGRD
jgi:deoxyribodipyrimidine photolyase-like uncharacterized protein